MSHYRQAFTIQAPPAKVYAALTTCEGLRGWWTQDCTVQTAVGGTISIRFGRTHKTLSIARLDPQREVQWLCTQAHIAAGQLTRPDEWVGTRMVFRLTAQDDGHTRLDFEHIGLVPAFECHDMCCDGWRYFLASLQQYAETGRGTPFEVAVAAAAH